MTLIQTYDWIKSLTLRLIDSELQEEYTMQTLTNKTVTFIPDNTLTNEPARSISGNMKIQLAKIWRLLRMWRQRSQQRRALAQLNDFMLKDIGISRSDASNEANKPFWKP